MASNASPMGPPGPPGPVGPMGRPGRGLLIWEAILTFATFTASGIGLVDVVSGKTAALLVLVVQGLNAATIVFKTGQWNQPPIPPVTVNVAPHLPEGS